AIIHISRLATNILIAGILIVIQRFGVCLLQVAFQASVLSPVILGDRGSESIRNKTWCCHAATNARSVSTVLLRPRGHTPRALVASGIASTVGSATGFRLRPGGGVTLRLRFARRSPPPPLHFLARRPQSEAYAHNWWDHVIRIHTKKIQ